MEQVVDGFIRSAKISNGLNAQLVCKAWDECSGAKASTLSKSFHDGVLRVTLGSSVVRTYVSFQKESIIRKINERLANEKLYMQDAPDGQLVKAIVLR